MSHGSCYHRYSQVSTDIDNLVMVVLRRAKCIAPCISSMYDHLWDHDNIHTVVYIYIYIYIYSMYTMYYIWYMMCVCMFVAFFSALSFVWMGMDNISLFVCFRHCFMDRRIVWWCLMGNVQRCDTLKCSRDILMCVQVLTSIPLFDTYSGPIMAHIPLFGSRHQCDSAWGSSCTLASFPHSVWCKYASSFKTSGAKRDRGSVWLATRLGTLNVMEKREHRWR